MLVVPESKASELCQQQIRYVVYQRLAGVTHRNVRYDGLLTRPMARGAADKIRTGVYTCRDYVGDATTEEFSFPEQRIAECCRRPTVSRRV